MPDIDLSDRSSKKYLSISKHQKNATNGHSKWESLDLEIETFNKSVNGSPIGAENKSWFCDKNLWGFTKFDSGNLKIIGTEKQQFGFFETPINSTDHWHGYPIIPFKSGEKKHKICKNLLDDWIKNKDITVAQMNKIIRGKLL